MTSLTREEMVESVARELFNYRRQPQQAPWDELPERLRDTLRTEAEFLVARGVRVILPTETVVPREPTEEMVMAAATGLDSEGFGVTGTDARDVYRAMLAATSPSSEGGK